MNIDLDQVKILLEMVGETDISELTIEVDEERITIRKSSAMPVIGVNPSHSLTAAGTTAEIAARQMPAAHTQAPAAALEQSNAGSKQEDLVPILAPMVGTFYGSPSPTAPPFVKIGDRIIVGQTICIIEAMKLMNDLPSEIAGRVVKICAENGSTIEYGQQLFLIDPKG